MTQDPYSVLGLKRDASDDEVRKAYRKLAREFHPDVNPDNRAAEERFKEVSSAYDILSDRKKRELFDEFGHDGLKSGFDADQARQYRQWGGGYGGGPGGGFRVAYDMGSHPGAEGFDIGDIFGDIFTRGSGSQRPRRGRDVQVSVNIDLRQALFGADIQVRVSGRSVPVRVRIPQGADTGSRLRVEGQGEPGPGGAPAGDLVIETRLKAHPYFRREGLNLHLKLPVTIAEAYTGATIQVPTPSGSVKLRIPECSQNGTRLRLRGKGVPKGGKQGDLYVELELRLPDKYDPKLAEALEKTETLYNDLRRGISL